MKYSKKQKKKPTKASIKKIKKSSDSWIISPNEKKNNRFGLRFFLIKVKDQCLTCWIFPMNYPTLILKFHILTTGFIISLLIWLGLTISANDIFILLSKLKSCIHHFHSLFSYPQSQYGSSVRLRTLRRLGLCLSYPPFIYSFRSTMWQRQWQVQGKSKQDGHGPCPLELPVQGGSQALNKYTNKGITTNCDECFKEKDLDSMRGLN